MKWFALSVTALLLTAAALNFFGVFSASESTSLLRIVDPPAPGATLSIGSVSVKPKEETAKFQEFADYLASRLHAVGVTQGRVVIAPTMTEMAELIKSGEVDLYVDSPFPIVVQEDLSGARPFLRRWKGGSSEYSSVLVVRKDSAVKALEDLQGKVVAFDEAFSTSGYLLPKATLVKHGLTLTPVVGAQSAVPSEQVGYIFSGDDENTLFWVLKGKAAAGAFSHGAFLDLTTHGETDLAILVRTITVPRHLVSHRPDLEPQVLDAIRQALITMHDDRKGRQVLGRFEDTSKFDELPAIAAEALHTVHELKHLIEEDLAE